MEENSWGTVRKTNHETSVHTKRKGMDGGACRGAQLWEPSDALVHKKTISVIDGGRRPRVRNEGSKGMEIKWKKKRGNQKFFIVGTCTAEKTEKME